MYKIKPVCFFSCYVFWGQQKLYSKQKREDFTQIYQTESLFSIKVHDLNVPIGKKHTKDYSDKAYIILLQKI